MKLEYPIHEIIQRFDNSLSIMRVDCRRALANRCGGLPMPAGRIFSIVALFVMAGCGARPHPAPAEHVAADPFTTGAAWRYAIKRDPIDDHMTCIAEIQSHNLINLSPPYGGDQRATLVFRDDARDMIGDTAVLALERGQFICDEDDGRSYNSCGLSWRVDSDEAMQITGYMPSDNSRDELILDNIGTVLMTSVLSRGHRNLIVRAEIYQDGNQTFEFDVSNFDFTKYHKACADIWAAKHPKKIKRPGA